MFISSCLLALSIATSLSPLFFLHSARQIQNIADELDEVHALGLTEKKQDFNAVVVNDR